MRLGLARDIVWRVTSAFDGSDERESEVADTARRAAMAASGRRRRARSGGEISADDVDPEMLVKLDAAMENLAAWTPGFAGAMLFRGEGAQPLVSLIASGEREAMRRSIIHIATAARNELDLLETSPLGGFYDSVVSTRKGAAIITRLGDDLLVTVIEGRPAKVADAWQAISVNRTEIQSVAERLVAGETAD